MKYYLGCPISFGDCNECEHFLNGCCDFDYDKAEDEEEGLICGIL